MNETSRDRLKALLKRRPNISLSEAATELGLSKQRIHQIAKAEGVSLRDARVRVWPESPHLVVRSAHKEGNVSLRAMGGISELLVCIDLLERGFDVYRSVTVGGLCDIVAVNRENLKTLRVEVKSARRAINGKPVNGSTIGNKFDVLARVFPGRVVEYEPDIK